MAFYTLFAYEASAGSGKTFALVIRYISLLYLDAHPASILALTFTNKAANEMKARITSVLKELHQPKRAAELQELSRILDIEEERILARRHEILQRYLGADLKISTIDKFLTRILRKFSLHLGLMPDFSTDARGVEEEVIDRFIKETIRHERYGSLRRFARFEAKKMKDIFDYFKSFYTREHEIRFEQRSCENQLKLERMILKKVKELKKSMFRCKSLSESGKKALNIEDVEALLSQTWLTKESLAEYRYFKKCFEPSMDEDFFELKSLIRRYFIAKECYFKNELSILYHIYKNARRYENITRSSLAFDDVSNMVYELLRREVTNEFLYFRLDAKIDHVLIDEFQDTNILQFRILEPIIDEISAGVGTGDFKSFFYVGDVKQSIYRFRGGAKELFYFLQHHYGIETEILNVNYRSYAKIVDFVNEVFEEKISHYTPQRSNDSRSRGFVGIYENEDVAKQVQWCVEKLLEGGVLAENVAILTQTNDDAFMIRSQLLKHHPTLQIVTETSVKLIHKPKVAAVIELLKFLYFDERLFLVNFLTIIGLSWQERPDLSDLSIHMPLARLIKTIIGKFELFEGDSDLLLLVELAQNYIDIEAFLFDVEKIDQDAPGNRIEGIRILTVHKSKGLEFDHVIVADRIKRPNNRGDAMLFEYEDIELKEYYFRFSKREYVDERYKNAWEKERKLSEEDRLNVQYVAFTRAKKSLFVCKKEKSSEFENLRLQIQERGGIEPDRHEKSSRSVPPLVYKPISVGSQEKQRSEKSEEAKDLPSVHFGIAMHYMLELMGDFDLRMLDQAYWGMRNRFAAILDESEIEDIKTRIVRLMEDSQFRRLTEGRCLHEQPLFYREELRVVDLLVEKEDRIIIIDYKSGGERRSEHRIQVQNYKEAISKIESKSVEGWICYLHREKIEWVQV